MYGIQGYNIFLCTASLARRGNVCDPFNGSPVHPGEADILHFINKSFEHFPTFFNNPPFAENIPVQLPSAFMDVTCCTLFEDSSVLFVGGITNGFPA